MLYVKHRIWPAALMALLLVLTASSVQADSKERIDTGTRKALLDLRGHHEGAGELLDRAVGVLVFPDVVKMGFGVGGQYGEGSLLVAGEPVAYYATAGASFGLQLGAQIKSEVLLFMTGEALQNFRSTQGWKVGLDASVALVKPGTGGSLDTGSMEDPIIGFIFSDKGLLYDLTMDGTKITRIVK